VVDPDAERVYDHVLDHVRDALRLVRRQEMKRVLVGALATGALLVAPLSPALADAGAPGSTFPEQPGGNVAAGCIAVGTHAGGGQANQSATAGAIVGSLFADACLGG
jgi:hypothetical protein